MQVSLLGSLDSLSTSEILTSLRNHFKLTNVTPLPNDALESMLTIYRQYMRDDMSDNWVVGEMKRRRLYIAGFGYAPTDMQIAAFVATMKQLKAGQAVQDPNERPSWSEVFTESTKAGSLPKTLLMTVGGIFILYGIVTTATSAILRK